MPETPALCNEISTLIKFSNLVSGGNSRYQVPTALQIRVPNIHPTVFGVWACRHEEGARVDNRFIKQSTTVSYFNLENHSARAYIAEDRI